MILTTALAADGAWAEPTALVEAPLAETSPLVVRARPFEAADLDSFFSSGPLRKAKEAFDAGQYRTARSLLDDQGNEPPVRYLRALASLRSGAAREVAEEFAALAEIYPAMRDSCLFYAGMAEERAGHLDVALARYQAVDSRSRLYAPALLAAARTLSTQGDPVRAAQVLGPLLDVHAADDVRAEALWALANLRDKSRDHSVSRGALLKLWSMGPRTALSAAAGRRLTSIPADAHVEHAEALLNANFGASARAELRPFLKRLNPPDPVGCRAHFLQGKSFRKDRRHALAIAELLPVVKLCEDPALKARALYILGYSQSVIDAPSAIITYETLAREVPDDPLAQDGLFLAADLRARTGDALGALAGYQAVTQRYPDSDFALEALFRAFWIQWRHRDLNEALVPLEQIELSHRADAVHRARYWHARTLEVLGRTEEAKALVRVLAADGTAGYYGEVARQRMAELDPARVQSMVLRSPFTTGSDALWPLDPGPLAADPHFKAGVELIRLGLPGAAAEFLAIDRVGLPPMSSRLLFQALYSGGYVGAASIFAQATLKDDADGALVGDARLLWEINFPKTFRDTIEKYSKRSGVDPDLLQALIREESHFAVHARSSTGALGLAQLMPATARSVAGSLRLHGFTVASLLQPERNIQIGSAYLAQLLHQFAGNRILAVAAYNAGPNAVRRWLAAQPDVELDEWVEEIPVQETREYVKRVLGSSRTYGQLYDSDWPGMLAAAD